MNASVERPDPCGRLAVDPLHDGLARALVRGRPSGEDAVQGAWLAGLLQREAPRNPVAWLAATTRRILARFSRTDRRRTDRETKVALAKPAGAPSAAAVWERENLRREIVAAVLALDEPLRDVVLLRYWEALPPRRVAERLGIPVETVRSRLKRAAAKLRVALDADRRVAGDAERDWRALLLPLAGTRFIDTLAAATWPLLKIVSPAAGRADLPAFGALLMSAKKLAAVSVVLLSAATAVWFRYGGAEAPPTAPPAVVVLRTAVDEPATPTPTTRAGGVIAAAPFQEPTTDDPDSRAAESRIVSDRIVVTAVFEQDRRPAAGAWIRLDPQAEDVDRRVRADEQGRAVFDAVSPGSFFVNSNYGGDAFGKLTPGREVAIELRIPPGPAIVGRVTDEDDRPVAEAEVRLGDLAETDFNETGVLTDAAGRFRIPCTRPEIWATVWARKDGYVPSLRPILTGKAGATLETTLKLLAGGAAVHGIVFDASGRPAAGAIATIGPERGRTQATGPDGSNLAGRPAVALTTDGDGRFAAGGLEPGRTSIVVRGRDFAATSVDIELVAGRDVEAEIRTGPAARLRGVVRNRDGTAVKEALLRLGDWNDPFMARTTTANDGSYRLTGLAAREFVLHVEHEGIETQATVRLVAGAETILDVVCEEGGRIAGRVVDERGSPIAKAGVEATGFGTDPASLQWLRSSTDDDGRFVVRGCRAPKFSIRINDPSGGMTTIALRQDVSPDGPELAFVIADRNRATAEIFGKVLDAEGRPVSEAQLSLFQEAQLNNGSPVITPDPADGVFRFKSLVPGAYVIIAAGGGRGSLRRRVTVEPEGRADAGEFRFVEPGRVVVRLRGFRGDGADAISADLNDGAFSAATFATSTDGSDTVLTAAVVAPGEYDLRVHARTATVPQRKVVVRSGATTEIEIPVRPGLMCTVRVRAAGKPAPNVRVAVRDADGAEVFAGSTWTNGGTGETMIVCVLPAGVYVVSAADDGPLGRASTELVIKIGAPEPVLTLDLRP